MASGLPRSLTEYLERHGIHVRLDLVSVIDEVFRRGFGYDLAGGPWSPYAKHRAGVYRRGQSMTRAEADTPAEALARALVFALNAEERISKEQIAESSGQ